MFKGEHCYSLGPYVYSTVYARIIVVTDLVVIHDSIQRLNPHWIDITIQHDPLWIVIFHVGHVTHHIRKQT